MRLIWRPLTHADLCTWPRALANIEAAHLTTVPVRSSLAERFDDELFDATRGSIAAFDGRRMIACGTARLQPEPADVHRIQIEITVHPWYGGSVGRRLLDRLLWRVVALHRHHHPALELEVCCDVNEHNVDRVAMLAGSGFRAVRRFWSMRHDLRQVPKAPVPDGLTLIRYRPQHDEAVRQTWNAAYAGDRAGTRQTAQSWRDLHTGKHGYRHWNSFLLIDDRTDEVAAFLLNRYRAGQELWITDIATRPAWRGRGGASALLSHALLEASPSQYRRAGLDMDADNPAYALELAVRFGFEVTDRWTTYSLPLPQARPDASTPTPGRRWSPH